MQLTSLRELSHYNRWQNRKLFALLTDVDDMQRQANRGLFFESIHGTLNHLLLADLIWMSRFTQTPPTFQVTSLAQILHEDFNDLQQARSELDNNIIQYIQQLDETSLQGDLTYTPSTSTNKEARSLPLRRCLVHFFNHQTHHRGQISAVVNQLGLDIGITDFAFMPKEEFQL